MSDGVVHVEALARADARSSRESSAAFASGRGRVDEAVFEPRTVAVIGANRQRGKIGAEILHNLQASGFTGESDPGSCICRDIQGLRAYRRVVDIPGPMDLAIIAVPSSCVLDAVDDCLAKGVRALCIISAGFGETGSEGLKNELILLDKVRSAGCRVIGPNCMGLLNTDPSSA